MLRKTSRIKTPEWRGLHQRLSWEEKSKIAEMVGYEPRPGQMDVHASQARNRNLCCGRRWGKSKCASFEAIAFAMVGGIVTCGAPTYDLTDIVWQGAVEMIYGSSLRHLVTGLREAKGSQVIELATGGIIDAKSTIKPQGILGRGRDLFILDEAALEPYAEVYSTYIRPSLSDRQGAFFGISTPRGMDWWYDQWLRGMLDQAGYASWQKPSSESLPAHEIAAARDELPEDVFAQEYLAKFGDAIGSVFRKVAEAATAEWQVAPIPGHRYFLGVDIAQHEDWTVIAVYDATAKCFAYLERFNTLDYPIQERFIIEASRYWNAPIVIDATNNPAVAQHIDMDVNWTTVEAFIFTKTSKPEVMQTMAIAIQEGSLRLLDPDFKGLDEAQRKLCRTALSEMRDFRYWRTKAGTLKMEASPGKHDDIVVAKALALYAAQNGGGVPVVGTGGSLEKTPSVVGVFTTGRTQKGPRRR